MPLSHEDMEKEFDYICKITVVFHGAEFKNYDYNDRLISELKYGMWQLAYLLSSNNCLIRKLAGLLLPSVEHWSSQCK